MKRYFIGHDNSGHRYLVEWDQKEAWDEWTELDEDDERSWDEPSYALRIDGSTLTFTDPMIL